MFAQCVSRDDRGLHRGTLGDENGFGFPGMVRPQKAIFAPGPPGELLEGALDGVRDEVVEKRMVGRGTQRKSLLIEQGARQHRLVEVMPGGQPTAGITEQHLLRLVRGVHALARRSDEALDLCRRQQADVLRSEGGLRAVHDDDAGYEGVFGDAAGDKGEIDRLLNAVGEQQEASGIGAEVGRVVTAARRAAVRGGGPGAEVQYERRMLPGR